MSTTVIDLVIQRLGLTSNAALARLLGVCRQSPADYRKRLNGGIPTRHWPKLIDAAKEKGVKLSYEDLRGK